MGWDCREAIWALRVLGEGLGLRLGWVCGGRRGGRRVVSRVE